MAAATPVEGRGDVWLLWQFFRVCDAACRDAILGFQVTGMGSYRVNVSTTRCNTVTNCSSVTVSADFLCFYLNLGPAKADFD